MRSQWLVLYLKTDKLDCVGNLQFSSFGGRSMATVEQSRPTTAEADAKARQKKRRQTFRIAIGSVAMLSWLGFFSAGLLVESVSWRRYLAPVTFEKQATIANASSSPSITKVVKDALTPQNEYKGSTLYAFFAASACFTPTNLALLALLAGLIGGCASNVVADAMPPEERANADPQQLKMLEETPWSAAMRSFIVYLCVIAGLYLTVDDPFKDSTSAQYLRLAGLVSALAFVVGYDPSRIQQWIRLLPGPMQSQAINVERAGSVNALQGPVSLQQPQNSIASTNAVDQYDPSEFNSNGKGAKSSKKKAHPKSPK